MRKNLAKYQEEMRERMERQRNAPTSIVLSADSPSNAPPLVASTDIPSVNEPLCSHCHRRVCRRGSALCSRCTGKGIQQELRDALPGIQIEKNVPIPVDRVEVKSHWKAQRNPNSDYIYAGVQEGQRSATESPTIEINGHKGIHCWMPEHGNCVVIMLGYSSDADIAAFGNGWHCRERIVTPNEPQVLIDPNQKYYTRKEVSNILGVSPTSICRWEQKGKTPPPIKIVRTGQLLYSEEHLQKMKEFMNTIVIVQHQPRPETPQNQQQDAAKFVAKKTFKLNRSIEKAVSIQLGRGGLGTGKLL